jgi:hypothetical protein
MNKDSFGIIFTAVITVGMAWAWVWIIFRNGAQKITAETIDYHKRAWAYHRIYELILHPIMIKFYATACLAACIFSVYLAISMATN